MFRAVVCIYIVSSIIIHISFIGFFFKIAESADRGIFPQSPEFDNILIPLLD